MIKMDMYCEIKGRAGLLRVPAHKGMTLIEVLVSLIVLSIGIMALLATQLRSVTGVREAEVQTVVAQAAQNLAEGMLANAELTKASDVAASAVAKKSFNNYIGESGTCPDNQTALKLPTDVSNLAQASQAKNQLNEFACALRTSLPPDTDFRFRVCTGEPEIVNSPLGVTCKPDATGNTYIGVAWQTQTGDRNAGLNTYSYTMQVAE